MVGLFLSVDTKEGNAQGVNPYGYVRENPETWTDPTGERACAGINNCPAPKPPPGPPGIVPGGSPTQTPTSGGCDAEMHPRPGDGMCVHDGSNCPADMQSGKGGCVYSSGECKGLTEKGCNQFKLEQRIHRAQADAQNEAAKLFLITGVMLMILADLPGWVVKLHELALFFGDMAVADAWNIVGSVIFGALSLAFEGAAVFLSGSTVTLALGALADARLAALFEQRATDNDPADWTSTAIGQFRSEVDGFTDIVNRASTFLSLLTGNKIIDKVIGVIEPTTNILYDFSGVDDTLTQITADMST